VSPKRLTDRQRRWRLAAEKAERRASGKGSSTPTCEPCTRGGNCTYRREGVIHTPRGPIMCRCQVCMTLDAEDRARVDERRTS
jgi:hypothetical protein